MSWTPDDFKAKAAGKDADLGAAVVAAGTIVGLTADKTELVQIAGLLIAGVILTGAILGRYHVRRGGVDAAGLAIASETAAEAGALQYDEIAADRDDHLLQIVAAGQAEQDDLGIPPSIEDLPVDDGEGDGDLPGVDAVDLG